MTIKEIQILLKHAGYSVTADGVPGPKTIQAIKDFQKKSGLTVDGDAGAKTIAALQKHSASAQAPVIPVTTNLLKEITDKPTLAKIALLHPIARPKATKAIQRANLRLTGRAQIRIVQGLRTFAEQDALYAQRPKVSNAKGGQSIHNYGLAFDFCLLVDGKEISWDNLKDYDGDGISDWMEAVRIFQEEGFLWGGSWTTFKDLPHLELYHEWRLFLAKYNKKDFIRGTTYVNI